ncbi:hypothetical protein ElyMa_000561400 [Elysia marginata]|uniref:Uncharacterized protein n=1 Tax=Elysia marginata TaxID=1093978 RepID=A0AAV4G296_9GAST|nr:hypothetical protein ElyMa_000561400 [Elysia marginata]
MKLTIDLKLVTDSAVSSATWTTQPLGLHIEGSNSGHAGDSQCRSGGAHGGREVRAVRTTTTARTTSDKICTDCSLSSPSGNKIFLTSCCVDITGQGC